MDIRIAERSDWSRIVDLYNEAVVTGYSTADTALATVDSKRSWLESHSADRYPVYVAELESLVVGWCSCSPYRPGRLALRRTAEISYYVARSHWRRGIGSELVRHAIADASRLDLRTFFGILLESNVGSAALLERLGFEKWGFLPGVADFDGEEIGHAYWGKRVG